ncbi:MAG: hypothetical protein HYS77_13555 [Candidatus Rokubacteria bacterium]|nr:hypothetical protein [Candidatus Rokubacteria bacterium]
MKTASFFTWRGPGRISIARWEPRGLAPGFRRYPALAPRREMLRMPYGPYRNLYLRDILGPLDPGRVADDLHRLAGGFEPVLLCWERPPFTAANWCHRRMVAEWFAATLGLEVPECTPEEALKMERAAGPAPARPGGA